MTATPADPTPASSAAPAVAAAVAEPGEPEPEQPETPPEGEPGPDGEPAAPEGEADGEPAPLTQGQERLRARFSDYAQKIKGLEAQLASQAEIQRQAEALREQEITYWRQQALQRGEPAPAAAPAPPDPFQRDQAGRPVRPEPEQFQTMQHYQIAMAQYEDAVHDWRFQQNMAAIESQQAVRSVEMELRTAHPDYDKVVNDSKFWVNADLQFAMANSAQLPYLKYYLATHPAEEARLRGVTGLNALAEVGRLEVIAQQALKPPANGAAHTPNTSHAPPPITPTRASVAAPQKSYDQMDPMEFFRVRNKEEYELRRR